MKFQRAPIALAAFAVFTAHAAPTVSFKKPTSGATLSGSITQNANCEVTGSNIDRVKFFLDSTALNTEENGPWQCDIDTTKFTNGSHKLRAAAYDTAGASKTAEITINISNGSTNTPPAVSITSPGSGQTVSGPTVSCAANASDSNGVQKVDFFLDSATTPFSTDTASPYACSFDNTTLANGSHTLKAVATDTLGATKITQVSFTVANGTGGGGNPAPVVSFKTPANGFQIPAGGALTTCEVNATDSNGIQQVQFFMNGALYMTEKNSPWTCAFVKGKFPNGAYTLKAVATDKAGATGSAQINITIGTTQPPPNTPPSVNLTAPAVGQALSGNAAAVAANATDNVSVAKVDFFLVTGSTQTPIGSKNAAPYQGTFNSTAHPNGAYAVMAVATDNLGLTSSTQRNVTINNVAPDPDPDPNPNPGTGTTLPSTNAKAVATFESLGMYWKPGSNPGAAGCSVRYRKFTESAWKEGLAMWYDARDSECRGSLVHLEPGTDYAVEMGTGSSFTAGVNTKTWSENFPIARTVQVASGSQTLAITESGTKDGYVLYTGPATIDVADAKDYNVTISAKYVIVRGLTLKGAKIDGIRLLEGSSDVVIEDNDISGWGSYSGNTLGGVQVGGERQSAIRANCSTGPWLERTVIQRNKMHHPRYGANSWDHGHPLGPQAIAYSFCGGNHVMRHNEVYSSEGHYFKDGIAGESNFSATGFPVADTDIYGNSIKHAWDDGIEAEGGNRNVRIWGNYIDQTAIGIASTVVHHGPLYIFRNVYNRSRMKADKTLDTDDRQNFAKAGTDATFGDGRRYVLHNTLLQATQAGVTNGLGAGGGIIAAGTNQPLTNTVSRNNILHVWKPTWDSIRTQGGGGNDFDYDLRSGGVNAYAGAETHGIVGTPIYKSGHGWSSWEGGTYQLDPSSPGYKQGVRLPNFSDGYTGSGPDMGAHESGTPAMKFGIGAGGSSTQ